MKKKDWQALVDHICRESVAPRLERILDRLHPLELKHEMPIQSLIRAMKTIRYIESEIRDDQDLTEIFSAKHLNRLLHDLIHGLRVVDRWIVQTGIADEIRQYHSEIVDRMEAADFPEIDVQLLRDLGYDSPEQELVLMVRRSKKLDAKFSASNSNDRWHLDFSHSIESSIEILESRCKNKDGEESIAPTKQKRKWLKGLGAICKGSAFTIVDATLLGGFWNGIVPPHMASVGAVVSITTGLGDILSGAGDLRGE
ncbi:hypothetical protein [Adhaeretor mobilis]|uniref:Uncharacterized protein n=1 Tax=Adhaeretor mobilis TaxID=1930276 RepID=A0A517MRU9_9BACT|nr:hypothetical protein [Adhaeretor mobilis]QDS97612.1 hypothetical protein HG15A2_08750 [Adhaeretor mobilis]